MPTTVKKVDLHEEANKLLSQNGFLYNGQPKKSFSPKQYFFERKTVMRKPMGNQR